MNKLLYSVIGFIGIIVTFGIVDIAAHSATFTVKTYFNSEREYIQMEGEITGGDVWRLNSAISDLKNKDEIDLFLHSPGGNLGTTLELNEIIKENKINTIVGKDMFCMSGCAVMWTYGNERIAFNGSEIGFHVGSIHDRDFLKLQLDLHGLFGFQTFIQQNFAWFMKYYSELPVKDGEKLAFKIATEGFDANNFFVLSPTEIRDIIGGRYIN